MMIPDTLNARIAIAKGWSFIDIRVLGATVRVWRDSEGTQQGDLRDWIGALAGVAELMRELMDAKAGPYVLVPNADGWLCAPASTWATSWKSCYFSPPDHPGDCVGKAWLSVFGKGATDARET